ncbi:condensin complex subunit 3-like [Acyrthosiphon pisum]|uniref:Nuclear condensin complex subunit 3 C-terminal domain-containing protein n=1 Tax=Acyrthosiphon pisum TaxID=7029 RepID=A0A8R2AZ37_ACYPI|nr:condensin complex subunit 3-like [Acyrthosiphon pisum]|eukprot:XP_008178929.1 PREDICTED: condensin complex subunit 3-like [Acyrthosiphon pisum]
MASKKSFIKLFEKAGEVGPQPNLLKILKDKFIDKNWEEFCAPFMDSTMSVIVSQTPIQCVTVNNMIKFAANGLSILSEHSTKDERSGWYLISEFFQLFRKYGNSNDKAIRWRFCLFLNHLLNHMTEGTVLSVELCDVATMLLLDRLQDKKPDVRAQAVLALSLLQNPDNPKICPIVKQFIFHMTRDSSAEVRTVIVKKIAMFNNVIDEMLKNTLFDVSDNVRREAFNRFLEYPFSRFSSKQRQTILEIGLEDKNESIISLVKKRFLESWLDKCNNDFVVLLNNLGVENEIVCEKALNIIFETYYDSQVLDFINEYLNSDSRMIALDKLSVEKIFLWKCIAKYLTTEKKIELARNQGHVEDYYLDILLPDLTKFSDYIRDYYFNTTDTNEFILIQLLEMTSVFPIDDVGAESLNKLCLDLIMDDQLSVKPIKSVAVLFGLTFKNGKDLLNYVKQILNKFQTITIDIYPLLDKVGTQELLEYQVKSLTDKIEDLLKNESPNTMEIQELIFEKKKLKKQYKKINVLPEEKILVDMAVKNVLKVFELVFQVQQLPKVGIELSLLTDIVQNIIVGYLECSKVNIRMEAIRSLSPYLLVNNVPAAKVHMITLCNEIAKPMTDKHLLFKIMFELLMRYDLKTFDINDDLDTGEEYEDDFCVNNILPLLVNCIDYDVDDSSFKSVIVKGFCNLLIFKKVKSISLLSKLLLLWFIRLSRETFSICNHLVKFFTSYVFYIDSSSSALAMCYVPVLKEINEYNLADTLGIKMYEVNSTLMNLTRGLMYKNEKKAINAHGELACYILDYILDENQPYTAMLVDTLYKLEIDFDNNDEFVNTIGSKLLLKKESFLIKINEKKVDTTEKEVDVTEKELDSTEMDKGQTQTPSTVNEEPVMMEVHEDLFTEENVINLSSDDEDNGIEGFQSTKLNEMKRLSEVFKRSFNGIKYELTSDDSD